MATRYEIHPSIGIARVGNSEKGFYLAPDRIGGLPYECRDDGSPVVVDGQRKTVSTFKDDDGKVRRQAAVFRVFAHEEIGGRPVARELTIDDAEFEWTVHVANKKAAWYENREFDGNLMLSTPDRDNSYAGRHVPLRNAGVAGTKRRRQELIIDPGPRTVKRPGERVELSPDTPPSPSYAHVSFPTGTRDPNDIGTLGRIQMDASGHLVVLGGLGLAGGQQLIATYTGADTWFDDISDGPVTCKVRVKGSASPIELTAWVLVAPPKFAPELRSISTLDDVAYDVGVRFFGLVPDLYDGEQERRGQSGWNPNYVANYARDIRPIIERPGDYVWVANVPTMVAFARPQFDPADRSEANRANRENYFAYFRNPGLREDSPAHQQLLATNNVPLMPVNSGSNSVTNDVIDKFMSLTLTQYKLLELWARGSFVDAPVPDLGAPLHVLDQAGLGNCVGHPMSPGVETSWNMRNPAIYERPYHVRHRPSEEYRRVGLDPGRDECEGGGCEPGDLTKRMSPPWQSDLYQCSVEWINFDNPQANYTGGSGIPDPPAYYAYWWPPQAPMHVMSGDMTKDEQRLSGVSGGQQVLFQRGLDNISRLVLYWPYLGFIVNVNTGPDRAEYPTFVERERAHEKFIVTSVAVGQSANQMAASGLFQPEDNYFVPMWTVRHDPDEVPSGLHLGMRRRHRGR